MTAPQNSPQARIRFGKRSRPSGAAPGFGLGGALAGVVLVALVLGGLLWSAAAGQTTSADHPQLFGGSLVLEDTRPPTVIDLATGKITVRLEGVDAEVGADTGDYAAVQAVAVQGGTMLVNRKTGAFNFLEVDNFVSDPLGPGVGLGRLAGLTGAEGLAAGPDAYILRSAPRSTVSLVSAATVAAAAKLQTTHPAGSGGGSGVTAAPAAAVTPPGFAALGGSVGLAPGSAVVSGSDLWALVGGTTGCAVQSLHPVPSGHNGLVETDHGSSSLACSRMALAAAPGLVGLASPGRVEMYRTGASAPPRPVTVPLPGVSAADQFVPVSGSPADLWFLAHLPGGWSLVGVGADGHVSGPFALAQLGPASLPVPPVESRGSLYTFDRAATGQPTLWTVDPANGAMAPVRGQAQYPLLSTSEQDDFHGAEVIGAGPRVVFNNPGSLEAVVVFTDGSHAPVTVDKNQAISVSTSGPADLNAATSATTTPGSSSGGSTPSQPHPVPVVQPVSQQLTCANTTQKPYAPQITAVSPSSDAALVTWSYQLLDQTDCEPNSWAVHMVALTGGHQPAQPTQVLEGQSQYTFVGLRPATTYQATVTAYINQQSTPSPPVTFTTAARGPDAPLAVRTAADGNGNWVVSWTPCTEAQNANCVVPADQWNVIGAACGSTFVGTPPTVQVAGTADSVTISATSGGGDLLGDSLSFSVQGVLVSGLTGNPTSDHSCTEAWKAPDPSAITLAGSASPAAGGNHVDVTLQVQTTGDPTAAFGSQDTEFVYSVGGQANGPTTQTQVTFNGLTAGASYTPTVQVYPAGHQSAAITVTGAPITKTNIDWPDDLEGGTHVDATTTANPNVGALTVSFPADLFTGSPAADLSAQYSYSCGSSGQSGSAALAANGTLGISNFDLVDFGGSCSLTVTLTDHADPNPYGTSSPRVTADFSIGSVPDYAFTTAISQSCILVYCSVPDVQVNYTGSSPLTYGSDFEVQTRTSGDDGPVDLCKQSIGLSGPNFPYTYPVPVGCNPGSIETTVVYKYLGQQQSVDAGTPSGTPATTTTSSSTTSTTVPCPTTTSSSTTPTTKAGGGAPCTTTTTAKPGAQAAAIRSSGAPPATSLASEIAAPSARTDARTGAVITWLTILAAAWPLRLVSRRSRRRSRRRRPERENR